MGSLIAAAAAVAAVQRGGPHLAGYLSKGTRTAENLKMNERHSAGRTDCKPFFGSVQVAQQRIQKIAPIKSSLQPGLVCSPLTKMGACTSAPASLSFESQIRSNISPRSAFPEPDPFAAAIGRIRHISVRQESQHPNPKQVVPILQSSPRS